MAMKTGGFTLVELVVTIGILAIVAAVAAPRFFQASTFQSRGFYDKSAAVIRLAQKTAIAWRRPVFVCVTAAQVSAGTASGCGVTLTYPVNGAAAAENSPPGVTLNAVEFSFDGLGRPSAGANIVFTSTIAGDPARQITVAAETGYVLAN
ncbi:MAG: prepilin-type N-terminal cleavage/methylation domain-containing protein [Burkholderiales bacterium]|nr:prepilin-type N-terminal cleavage/methylation domain-containing protein [Burkholderiales bacterium]MCW5604788.1 prepilin-type N-terminal cleavage/methylation domain-containing protein [Burkholderiales bacterium]